MHDSPQLYSPDAFNPVEFLNRLLRWAAFAVALGAFALVLLVETAGVKLPGKPGWPMALLLVATALATVVSLCRQLPVQNVLLGATIIAVIGTLAHTIGAATGIPFGPFQYTAAAGPRVLKLAAWPMAPLWIIAVLSSRGVARLILRPWRKLHNYGFWLIALTVVLTVVFDAVLEPVASVVKRYWVWQPTRIPLTWAGTPLTNFLGWLLTTLLIMAFVTPALIDKRARPTHRAPDYHPLIVWLLGLGLFALNAALNQLWSPFVLCLAAGTTAGIFAVRGARW